MESLQTHKYALLTIHNQILSTQELVREISMNGQEIAVLKQQRFMKDQSEDCNGQMDIFCLLAVKIIY